MVRTDKSTGIVYTTNNIPLKGRKGRLTALSGLNGYYTIFNQNKGHDEDSWYDGKFIGDSYAVFKWINTTPSTGFYQQVSPWYIRYGNAQRKMVTLARELI